MISDADVMTATRFFIGTLAVSHPKLDEGKREENKSVDKSVCEIRFM